MHTRTVYAVAAALAAVLVATTSALAGSGVGGVFNLGQVNTVDAQTSLTGNPGESPLLKATTLGTAAAVRGVATTGIGTNGISTSGVGQQGFSNSGIGTLGTHGNTTGISPGVQGETNSTDPNGAGVVGKNNGGGPALRAIVNAAAAPLAVNSSVKVANLNADLLDGLDSPAFQKRVSGTCGTGSAIKSVDVQGTVACEPVGGGGVWSLKGNAGTAPGTNFLGTTDNQALELKVNGQTAFRLEPNATSPNVIGGFSGNGTSTATPHGVTIAGGGVFGLENLVTDDFGTVGGGGNNTASGAYSAVAGGKDNTAPGDNSTVVGGDANLASGNWSAVAGGAHNTASGIYSAVAGGQGNTASGANSTVAGGEGNTASGAKSIVAGGEGNTASGAFTFAAGYHAKAGQVGSFVWGDTTLAQVNSPAPDTFIVRASGGIWFGTTSSPSTGAGSFINTSTGAFLSSAGVWTNSSDRAKKHDFRPLDKRSLLERLARMPVTSWSYKAEQRSTRHIGPMAQNFYKAFRLGLDNKHITTIDEGGVALAAIQGLYRQNQALERQNRSLNARLSRLEGMVAKLTR
jgi:hypothetical protein